MSSPDRHAPLPAASSSSSSSPLRRRALTPRESILALALVIVCALLLGGWIGSAQGAAAAAEQDRSSGALGGKGGSSEPKRDFLFQIVGYETANQGGQTMNMYFHYRYNEGIATADIPNYVDLRTQALNFMAAVDTADSPYWETLDLELCTTLKDDYPLEAISCQLQVYPDDRAGLPYEPGYHGTTTTIGDIDALAFAGPLDSTE
ncbi:MAG: hypothetical protein JWQ43_111 [Glaciihabitans sp.]|nr:hypothetical protein [Glaciihabitans sp.]